MRNLTSWQPLQALSSEKIFVSTSISNVQHNLQASSLLARHSLHSWEPKRAAIIHILHLHTIYICVCVLNKIWICAVLLYTFTYLFKCDTSMFYACVHGFRPQQLASKPREPLDAWFAIRPCGHSALLVLAGK